MDWFPFSFLFSSPSPRRIGPGWAVLVLAFLVGNGVAQESPVSWRQDYNEARKEALAKGRPLLIDFCTENCFWCAKLETTTFSDQAIAGTLNQQFIPLKIFAEQNPQLTQALHVERFPTLVMAAPDGKIINSQEGYQDIAKFQENLQLVLEKVKTSAAAEPDNFAWMAKDLEEANGAVKSGQFTRALTLLRKILADKQERPTQVKARVLLVEVEKKATEQLARAKEFEGKGKTEEARDAFTEMVRVFPGTPAAVEGSQKLAILALKPNPPPPQIDDRTRKAREFLAQAREDYRNQQFLCCIDRCDVLGTSYADLPEGAEAMLLMGEIKNNPEWMKQACDTLSDRLGNMYLGLAETYLKKGEPHQAEICLEKVIQAFPGTPQAEVAMNRLSQIRGEPTQQAEGKKP